jgi:uncharacterized protein
MTTTFFSSRYISLFVDMIKKADSYCIVSNKFLRFIFILGGTIFLGLGIIGVFLPVLPTTPFLLLTAACYARGSKRFYDWLMNNKLFGNYIKNYCVGRGIPLKVKIFTISLLWITILFSAFFVIDNYLVELILIIIAIAVTIHILKFKTYK